MVPIVSIVLAIGLPVFALWKHGKGSIRRPYLYSIGSFTCCAGAMIAELLTVRSRLFAGDIGGIEDTIGAVIVICVGLLVCTTILNLLLLGITCEKKPQVPA